MNRGKVSTAQWWQLVWVPVLTGSALYGAFVLIGSVVAWWQLWLLSLAGLTCVHAVRSIPVPDDEEAGIAPTRDAVSLIVDRPFGDVNRWEDRLSWGRDDVDRFEHTTRSRVAALAVERLRLRHGVSLSDEPDRARNILGDRLFRLVTEPATVVPSRTELDEIVHSVEEI